MAFTDAHIAIDRYMKVNMDAGTQPSGANGMNCIHAIYCHDQRFYAVVDMTGCASIGKLFKRWLYDTP